MCGICEKDSHANCETTSFGKSNFLTLTLYERITNIEIAGIYHLPSLNEWNFIDDVNNTFESRIFLKQNIKIFTGDVNINILEDDEISHLYLNTMAEFGYVQKIDLGNNLGNRFR